MLLTALLVGIASLVISPRVFAAQAERDASPAPTVLLFGDSLTAGYGLAPGEGWADLLARELDRRTPAWRVVNASVSGETTAGGRTRLARALEKHRPRVLVLELGGNDGLRGMPVNVTRSNLAAMIAEGRKAGAEVVLVGVRIPPNYGPDYAADFEAVFTDLAAEGTGGVHLVRFLLKGVALDFSLMQPDGIHPTAAAQPRLLENVRGALFEAIAAAGATIRQD
ncbi:MAG: arylesterase [Pseudomonadota bacterium]